MCYFWGFSLLFDLLATWGDIHIPEADIIHGGSMLPDTIQRMLAVLRFPTKNLYSYITPPPFASCIVHSEDHATATTWRHTILYLRGTIRTATWLFHPPKDQPIVHLMNHTPAHLNSSLVFHSLFKYQLCCVNFFGEVKTKSKIYLREI